MTRFDHERLDAYRISILMVADLRQALAEVRRGEYDLVSQTKRAAVSVTLNIAEGSGEFSPSEKLRFYRIARRSAAETAAALDIIEAYGLISGDRLTDVRSYLDRIAAMLTVLTRTTHTR
jgi:four helix bundle protein